MNLAGLEVILAVGAICAVAGLIVSGLFKNWRPYWIAFGVAVLYAIIALAMFG